MYSVYLFDFDYTLGDSTEAVVESVNFALSAMGFPAAGRDDVREPSVCLSAKPSRT
jgi:phosphoglycolate phosphatase-like HAD superfamily hydrolase